MWFIYAIAAAATWGLDYALGERVIRGRVSPVSLMIFQMAGAFLFFLPLGIYTDLSKDLRLVSSDRNLLGLILIATLSFIFGNWLVYLAIQSKNATAAGLIELCYPLFTALFVYLLFNENQFTPGLVVGGGFILIGIGIIGFYG